MLGFGQRTLVVGLAALSASALHAQSGHVDPPVKPSRPTLEAYDGQPAGLWVPVYGGGRGPSFDVANIKFKPWAKGLFDSRQQHDLEPHARCKPSGAVRQLLTPYGIEIVEVEELGRIYIFDIGGPHSFREVFMDGRGHPPDVSPSYYGHNIGWWEGDTLVVDTIGMRDDTWIDWNGSVVTEAAKIREEIRRPDFGHLEIKATVDDPKAYTKPWTVTLRQRIVVDAELIDEICLENEQFVERMGLGGAKE